MRIGLNLLFLLPGVVGGTETYAVELIEKLAAIDTDNEYLLFMNRDSVDLHFEAGPNFKRIIAPVRATNRGARYAWEQLVLPRRLLTHRIDLLHSLGYVGPLRASCPHVVTIHDVNYQDPAVQMSWQKRRVLGAFVRAVAVHADHILTISEFSKTEIVARLGISPNKVTASHLAPRSTRDGTQVAPTHDIACGAPYVIALAGSARHKNIPRLIAAFAKIAEQVKHRLIIVGHLPDDGSVGSAVAASGVAERIILTGYLTDSDLTAVLAGADVLAFPSLYEGFGLPVLDAQAAGVAVVCSNAGSLPEVAGSGALLFEPTSVESISRALVNVLRNTEVRSSLVRSGYANVRRFSWGSTAETALSIYKRYARARLAEAAL